MLTAARPSRSASTPTWCSIIRRKRPISSITAGAQFKEKLIFPDLQKVDWDYYYTAYQQIPAVYQQQLRFRRDDERDARRDERLAHRCLLLAAVSEFRCDRVARALLRLRLHRQRCEDRRGHPGRAGRSGRIGCEGRATSSKRSTARRSTRRWISTSCSIARPANTR